MPYVITEPCVGTKNAACVDVCPVDCIHESSNQYYVDPEVCIDCGACEPACPVQAIFNETEVPSQWTSYIQTNRTLAEKR
ncbi:MAG TPA: ferredoxin family protein [Thermoanaerobaculia bacterium]|jgi:NAD-dependent dihydropyrimidine dehydrogenase PreA subunit